MKITVLLILLFCIVAMTCHSQILSPMFNDARLVSKNQGKASVGYSAVGFALSGERVGFLNSLDFQGTYGLSEKVNLTTRYQHSWYASEMFQEWAMSFLFVSANICLKKDRVSFLAPLGTRFSSIDNDGSYFEFSPTMLFTIPITNEIAFNPAIEVGMPFCKNCTNSPFISADLGLGITPIDNLTFYAEYDLVYSSKDFGDGHYYMFNAGVSFKFGE